jgi:hypothetical protein
MSTNSIENSLYDEKLFGQMLAGGQKGVAIVGCCDERTGQKSLYSLSSS